MTKKPKRYDEGGEIVVSGRPGGFSGLGTLDGTGYMLPSPATQRLNTTGVGGGSGMGQRLSAVAPPAPEAQAAGPRVTPTVVSQPRSEFGRIAGAPGGSGPGVRVRMPFKKGGKVKKMAKGGSVSSASKRGDGIATKGKTKGKFV